MNFAVSSAIRNLKRKPFRTTAIALVAMFLSFAVFCGAFMVDSLQRGLQSYQARLGADIIVVPSSATSHGMVDDIFLQGITGNYYMSEKDINKVLSTDGIEQASQQFFLTSAKASCCSSRVQIIGFDPDTDFTVLPWIDVSYVSQIMDGDLIVGSNINVPQNKEITFYNTKYHVAGQLAPTGTGLDSAVYTNIDTIKKMAGDASNLLDTNPFQGVNIDTCASAVFIKVADGYNITDVADDINIHITKVEASSARTMISDIAEGLGNVSMIIRIVVILVWILAAVILVVVQALLSNERKKEFAVLRIMGASRKMLFQMMSVEAVMTGLIGAVAGIGIALILIYPISGALKNALGLPFLAPTAGSMVLFGISALVISIASGILTAVFFARRITKSETGLLLREDS